MSADKIQKTIKFLEFRDKQGKVLSVAQKTEASGPGYTVSLHLEPSQSTDVSYISQEEFRRKSKSKLLDF